MRSERIVHIGMGAFFKAHQAWYTQHASDSKDWGIVAYTGRSAKAAQELKSSGNKYTLVTRFADHDEYETIDCVVRTESAENLEDFYQTVAKAEIAIVSMTITEAGYQVDENLPLEQSALGRLSLALERRRVSGGLPIALVPCDNMPDNGEVLARVLSTIGKKLGKKYLDYLAKQSFVSTSVDRITPRITSEDLEQIATKLGKNDPAAVVTEPFADWVLSGDFPLGRPNWESSGARFVAEIEPFENRKLWLLNGAHTLLACMGLVRGIESVDGAIKDPEIAAQLQNWWNEAASELDSNQLKLESYLKALAERFANPRIRHQLSQIAIQSLTKLRVRISPVASSLLAKKVVSKGAVAAIANYLALISSPDRPEDALDQEINFSQAKPNPEQALLELISTELAHSDSFSNAVLEQLETIKRQVQSV